MPNHVMNIVRFSGDRDAIRRMREAIQNPEYGIGSIDFNRIIPMPPSLDMEESSCTRAGLRAYQDFIEVYTLGGTINADRLSDIPAASEEAFLKTRKDVKRDVFALGKQAWNNLLQYGKATWYGWCTDNWGTKWNAYGFDEAQPLATSDDVLAFQTAWNAPHPVMKAFSAKYPAIRMEHWWADEDVGFNCGKRIYENGVCTERYKPDMGSADAFRLSAHIWGGEPEHYGFRQNNDGTGYLLLDDEEYDRIEICGQPALFTNARLTNADIPSGLYLYHLRGSDDGQPFGTLEESVSVNHSGSIVTLAPIDLGEDGYIPLTEETEPNFLGVTATFEDFLDRTEQEPPDRVQFGGMTLG